MEELIPIVDPILEFWRRGGKPGTYRSDEWGPESAHELIRRDGREWRDPRKR